MSAEVKPGYKQTEVGLIPDSWTVKPISECMRLLNGRAFKPSEWASSGLPIIRIQNLNNPLSEFNYYPFSDIEDRHRIQSGDLLFAWSGTLGSSFGARSWQGPEGVLNQHIFKVIPDAKFISSDYALVAFKRIEDDIAKKAHGFKTSFVHIKKSDLDSTLLSIPCHREQKAIALALGEIDSLISNLDQLITKKRDIQQAAIQQLLTGERRLPGFSGAWDVKPMRALGNTYGGLAGKTKINFGHGEARYIPFMNVMTDTVIDASWLESVDVAPDEAQNLAKKGDLFFNGSSETPEEVGFCSVLLEEIPNLYLNSFCFGFRFNTAEKVSGLFFAYWFRSKAGRAAMSVLAQGATRYNIAKSAFMKLEIPQPSEEEQTAIATVLSDMDAELAALNARRNKARQLKQGMMQELLTGRIRLA